MISMLGAADLRKTLWHHESSSLRVVAVLQKHLLLRPPALASACLLQIRSAQLSTCALQQACRPGM